MILKKTNKSENCFKVLWKKSIHIFALIGWLHLFSFSTRAELTIDITQGNIDPMPIAITSFQSTISSLNSLGAQISAIISADLERCGLFKPLDPSSFIQNLESLKSGPRFADWRLINAQTLVKGELKQMSSTDFRVEFYLYDVMTEKQLEGLAFTGSLTKFRQIAHKISDAIYKRVTGDEGYFNTEIAYVAQTGPSTHRTKRLAIMDQDGAHQRYLSTGQNRVLTPRFSPNGQEIAYLESFNRRNFKVYLMSRKTGQRQVVGNFKGLTFAPRFSPNGKSIIMSFAANGQTSLYTKSLSSPEVRRLTKGPHIDTTPYYSPDGSQIAFVSDRTKHAQIYIMSSNGGNITQISQGKGRYYTPVWSPRGDLIAFTKTMNGSFYIGVMKIDGTGERLLARGYVVEDPCWSPNGRVIMFTRVERSDRSKIYTIDLTGSNERVVETPTDAAGACWSPLIQ